MKKVRNNELTDLQNFADKFDLIVKLFFYYEDKRKNVKFVLTNQDEFISPKLNYAEMNHFLLGIDSCIKNKLITIK